MNQTVENKIDRGLILEANAGNGQSLELLIGRYLPSVYGLCLRYLQEQADAEDATQETFVKVWKKLAAFDQEKNFRPWVLEIAKNTCLDILKKKKIIPFSDFETGDGSNSLTETLIAGGLTPHEFTEQSSFNRILNTALCKLPAAYQNTLSLYYGKQLNFREISEHLNEPLHTVKSRHRRAIGILKKMLD